MSVQHQLEFIVQKKVYFDFDTGSALNLFIIPGIGGSKVKISEPGMD